MMSRTGGWIMLWMAPTIEEGFKSEPKVGAWDAVAPKPTTRRSLNTTPSSLCDIWFSWFLKHRLGSADGHLQRLTNFWITFRSVFAKSNGSPSFVASVVSEATLCRESKPRLLLLLLDWCVKVLSSSLTPSGSKKLSSTREIDDPRRGRARQEGREGEGGALYRDTICWFGSAFRRAGGEGALETLFESDSSCMSPRRLSVILNRKDKESAVDNPDKQQMQMHL